MSDSESESDDVFAGIAVFPAGVEEYNLCIALVSSTGSFIDSLSFSSPAERTVLEETMRSTIMSTILKGRIVTTYISSVPPAFPPDKHYDVFKALRLSGLIDHDKYESYPLVPLNHAEAFTTLLPKGETVTILFLDFYVPPHLHVARLSSTEEGGQRVNTGIQEFSVSLADANSFQGILEKINSSLVPCGTNEIPNPEQIILIKPLVTSEDPGAIDVEAIVSELYPNVPVSIVTCTDIAQAAASFAYAHCQFLDNRPYRNSCGWRWMALPVTVATTSGTAIPISQPNFRIPTRLYVILTNSVDNQKSVTVRLMLGTHAQAKNNIQRAVVVLDGLAPLPKGEARIKVSIRVMDMPDGWKRAIRVGIDQKDGPKKKFLFPRFFVNLSENYEDKYSISVKRDEGRRFVPCSNNVVGKLPE